MVVNTVLSKWRPLKSRQSIPLPDFHTGFCNAEEYYRVLSYTKLPKLLKSGLGQSILEIGVHLHGVEKGTERLAYWRETEFEKCLNRNFQELAGTLMTTRILNNGCFVFPGHVQNT